MSGPALARPAICLNMIVRNEAHIVRELLDSAAPYISSWVIVDTGSDDGTQDVIREHMAALGIPGELHERPWRNFGHNRTEALDLARGHGDFIWVMDADDIVVGAPDFGQLTADVYAMRIEQNTFIYWRKQLFRDGLRWRYEGVLHEHPVCDSPHVVARLEGDYHIQSRRLGARNQDPQKYARDAELLLAEVQRNPEDRRSVFYLAQSYADAGDLENACKWYARRAEMGGWDEEVYVAMYRVADSMARLHKPWADAQYAYLRAWEYRPTRAEALHAIARFYRLDERYQLGYLYAQQAAQIPLPEDDILFVISDVYTWRSADEQAVCASRLDKHAEAFALCRSLVANPAVPEHERQRISENRDFSVPALVNVASAYPEEVARGLVAGPRDAEVTVTLVAGPDRAGFEQGLNSFLHCCTDVAQVGRFLVLDIGMSARDRTLLARRYGFLEFAHRAPADGLGAQLGQLRAQVDGRYWLHLGHGWRFFAPENYIGRLIAVLQAEAEVVQVGINFGDAVKLTGSCAGENVVRRAPGAGRYVLTGAVAGGPAMFDTARLDRAGGVGGSDPDPLAGLCQRASAAGLCTASLDEVLCVTVVP